MNRLNNDSLGHVLQFLPLRDRCHATTVCRLWAAVSRQTPVCLPVEMRFNFESTQQSDRKPRIAALPAATQSDGHSTTPYSGNVFGFAFSEAHFDTQSTDGGSDYQCFDHPVWELDFSAMNGSKRVFKKAHDELGAVAMQRFVSEIASYLTFLPGHPRRQWQLKFPDCTGPAMMVDMLAAIHECLPKDDDWQKVISRVRSIKVTLQSLRPVVIDVKSVDELSVELERAFAAIKTEFADTVLAAPQWRRLSTSYGSKLDLGTVAIDLVLAGCAAQEEHIAVINESVRRHGWVYVSRIAVAPDQASLVVLETDPIQFFEQCTVREAFTIEMPSTYSSMTKHVASTLCTLPWTTFDPRQKCEGGFLYKEMSPEGFDMRLALQINRLPLRHLFTRQDASMSLDRELPDTMSDEEFEQQTDILVSMMAAMKRSGWRAAGIWTHGTTKVVPSNEDMVLGRRSRFADLLADADLLPPQFYPEFVEAVATLQMSEYGKECRSAVAAARRALSSRFSALPGFSFGLKIGNYNIRFNGSAARPGQPFVEVAGDIFHLDSDSSEARDIYWKNVFFILNKLADVVPGMNDVPDAGRRLICTVATSPREASKFAHQYEQDGTVATEWHVESRLKLRDILRNLDADSSAHASWKTCWPQAVLQMVDSTFLQSTVSSMWTLAAANQTQKSSTTKIVAWEVDRFVLYAN